MVLGLTPVIGIPLPSSATAVLRFGDSPSCCSSSCASMRGVTADFSVVRQLHGFNCSSLRSVSICCVPPSPLSLSVRRCLQTCIAVLLQICLQRHCNMVAGECNRLAAVLQWCCAVTLQRVCSGIRIGHAGGRQGIVETLSGILRQRQR